MPDVQLVGLELGSSPLPGERWRTVVANVTRLAALQELVTFGWASTATQERADAWFESVASLGLGFPSSQPVAQGELFVVDMKFSSTHTGLLPLSAIVQRWEQQTPGTRVIRIERVPAGESSTDAPAARSRALAEAARAIKAGSAITRLAEAGQTAVSTLKLGFLAIIVAGGAYLISKARR